MQGFFQLKTPDDLLAKLERDLARMNRDMSNPDPAFDFFVPAEHMLDWLYPGKAGKNKREVERKGSRLLQLVSHIATGANHFEPQALHHTALDHTEGPSSDYPYAALAIYPDAKTVQALGFKAITTIGLADKVIDFWRGRAKADGWG